MLRLRQEVAFNNIGLDQPAELPVMVLCEALGLEWVD